MPYLREQLQFHSYETEAAQIRAEKRVETRASKAAAGASAIRKQEERRILESRRRLEEIEESNALQDLEVKDIEAGVRAPKREQAKPWGATGTMEYRSPYEQKLPVADRVQQLRKALAEEGRQRTIETEELPILEAEERIGAYEQPTAEPTTVGGFEERLTILKKQRKDVEEEREKEERKNMILKHAESFIGTTFMGALIDTPEELIIKLKDNKKTSNITIEDEVAIHDMDWDRILQERGLPGINELGEKKLTPEELERKGLRREAPKGYERKEKDLATKDEIIRKIAADEKLTEGQQKIYNEIIRKPEKEELTLEEKERIKHKVKTEQGVIDLFEGDEKNVGYLEDNRFSTKEKTAMEHALKRYNEIRKKDNLPELEFVLRGGAFTIDYWELVEKEVTTLNKKSPKERFNELIKTMSEDEAYKKLTEEGY